MMQVDAYKIPYDFATLADETTEGAITLTNFITQIKGGQLRNEN